LGTAGNFSVLLPITDDADLSPSGWVYNVSEVVDGVSQNYNILLPGTVAVGGTVYLADLVPAAPAGPEYYSLASSLTIGTVTTVATGGSATASITGLAPSQVLDLGIPTGATGTVASAGSGSVGTAAVAPTGDPDTGIYFPAANQVAVTTGGTQALLLAAGAVSSPTFTGSPTVSGTAAIDGSSPVTLILLDNQSSASWTPDARTSAIQLRSMDGSGGAGPRTRVQLAGVMTSASGAGTDLAVGVDNGSASLLERFRVAWTGEVYVGNGRASATPTTGDLRATAGSGTDVAGAELRLSGGAGTGSGAGGAVGIYTSAAGASGTTTRTLTERLRVDSNGLITGTGSLGAWTTYTPTLGGTGWAIGNGTASGFYCQIGKVMFIRVNIVFGNTSTFGAGGITCSLPANANGSFPAAASGVVRYVDSSASAIYAGHGGIASNTFNFQYFNTNGSGQLSTVTSTSAPFTWADTDIIRLTMAYEIA
jgi:hypothetical protein